MAFLGIKIPHETGRLLTNIDVPGERTAISDMHITILHFEDNWPISEMARAMETTYDIVSKIKPFLVTVEEVFSFPKKEDRAPIIARVKSAELHELQDKIAKEFDKDDIEFSKTYKDFKPHITLAYADKEIKEFKIEPVEFSVQELVLWGGDHGDNRIFITFPLKGPEKQKHSYLLQKINIFYKLASSSQAYLTPSYERRKVER